MTLKGKARTDYMRDYMRRRRASSKKQKSAPLVQTVKAQSKSTARPHGAEAEILKLKVELGRLREALAKAEAKLIQLPPGERDREVERLKTENRNLKKQVRATVDFYNERNAELDALKRRLNKPIPDAVFKAIAKVLHPDAKPSDKERAETFQIFNSWIDDVKNKKLTN